MAAGNAYVYSMTGFGRGTRANGQFRVTAEIRSVNGRFLEVRAKLPRGLQAHEPAVRALVQARLQRGVIDVALSFQVLGDGLPVAPALPLLRAYANLVKSAAGELNLPEGATALALLKLPGVLGNEELGAGDHPTLGPLVEESVSEALDNLLAMRQAEGGKLAKVIGRELAEVGAHCRWLEETREELNQKHAQRLRARVESWLGAARQGLDETRLYQEVAYYLDRSDVTEELDRLASHLKQCQEALERPDGKSVGKRFEFLVQELGREVNTVGAKSDHARVAARVVEMKLGLEKIREQVQNLE